MKKNKNIYSFSHIGNSRENHEDNYILRKGDFLSPRARKSMEKTRDVHFSSYKNNGGDFLVAISDGMGGHSSGEIASFLTVKYLSEHYQKFLNITKSRNDMIGEFSKLNKTITDYAKSNLECRNMGATLCGIICKEQQLIGFNIGDSRLYRFDNEGLTQLSIDHTEGQRLFNLNLLSKEEIETFPRKKHLYKYIGVNGELIADIFEVGEFTQETILLLCSDGLTDVLADFEIEAVLRGEIDTYKKGQTLMQEAIKRNTGCGDNITIIMVEMEKEDNHARKRNTWLSRR